MGSKVIIAGGGIGGLATALTLNQIGVDCVVFEAVEEMKPLGVGINLQPNAVRELFDLGFTAEDLDAVGVPAQEWALVGLNGNDIYSEERGTFAGYRWPQYAVHRGKFHMLLWNTFIERAGRDAVHLGARVTGYTQDDRGVTASVTRKDGTVDEVRGSLLIGADGIHSQVRAQMHPDQPPINWGGALMWRGTTMAKPIRTGSSFVGLGTHEHRMVIYPISQPDPETGLAEINWIAEMTLKDTEGWEKSGWFRPVEVDAFVDHFAPFTYDWLDVPAMLRGADVAYENPMIDRDPIPTWRDGRVALMGDAAHAMYPTGSNGASQAVIDARVMGAKMVSEGVSEAALLAYDETLCGPISEVVLRNRGAGPFGLLNMVEERCGGEFENIDDVIPEAERREFTAKYQAAAGFARDALNGAAPTIDPGARVAEVTAAE